MGVITAIGVILLPGFKFIISLIIGSLFIQVYLSLDQQTIRLTGLPTGEVQQGTVDLPFDTLCRFSNASLIKQLTCTVCNLDCIYVHNTRGGKCDQDPRNPDLQTCLCADTEDEAADRGVSSNTTSTCGLSSTLAVALVPVLKTVVIARQDALLCIKVAGGYNSTNCNTDCSDNHGALSGVCQDTPQIYSPDQTTELTHCLCTPAPAS